MDENKIKVIEDHRDKEIEEVLQIIINKRKDISSFILIAELKNQATMIQTTSMTPKDKAFLISYANAFLNSHWQNFNDSPDQS